MTRATPILTTLTLALALALTLTGCGKGGKPDEAKAAAAKAAAPLLLAPEDLRQVGQSKEEFGITHCTIQIEDAALRADEDESHS